MKKKQEKLKRQVVDQLYWNDRIDASNVKVKVEDGIVLVDGTVPSYVERVQIPKLIQQIQGVKGVENNLIIQFPPAITVPKDPEIRSSIRSLLESNAGIDASKINVSVNSGAVHLRGTVDSLWKKFRVEDIIADLQGVKSITNELTVVPTEDSLDEKIAEEVLATLRRNINVDVENVNIKVKEGNVHASGTVEDWNAYLAVRNAIRCTKGVLNMEDEMTIQSKIM